MSGKKYMILGVSFGWGIRKGIDVFIRLHALLGKSYQIVLAGMDEVTEKRLPPDIISIPTVLDQTKMAQLYTAADVFVNPTREENYPTVNLEAIACGTPVVTFQTGGSPESVADGCGFVVSCDDVKKMADCIRKICEKKEYSREDLRIQAEQFHQDKLYCKYIELYKGFESEGLPRK